MKRAAWWMGAVLAAALRYTVAVAVYLRETVVPCRK